YRYTPLRTPQSSRALTSQEPLQSLVLLMRIELRFPAKFGSAGFSGLSTGRYPQPVLLTAWPQPGVADPRGLKATAPASPGPSHGRCTAGKSSAATRRATISW